jgi:hypothetical protein
MLAEEGGGDVGGDSNREGRGGRLGLGRGEVGRWHFIREEGRVWAGGLWLAEVGQTGPLPRAHHPGSRQRDNFHLIKYEKYKKCKMTSVMLYLPIEKVL